MNPFMKARWVEDLRANPDLQGKARLADKSDGSVVMLFCCLGRACELFKDEAGLVVRQYFSTVEYDGESNYMPTKLARFLELEDVAISPTKYAAISEELAAQVDIELPFRFRSLEHSDEEDLRPATLARCNDNDVTLSQIADLIEYFL